MSKIQTNIVIQSPIEGKKKLSPLYEILSQKCIGDQLQNLSLQNTVNKVQLSPNVQTISSPPNFNKNLFYAPQKMAFNRFCPWNLLELSERRLVIKPNEQKKQINDDIKLEQSEEDQDEQYYQIMSTPHSKCNNRMEDQLDLKHPSSKINLFGMSKSQKVVKPKQTGLRKLSGKAFKIVKQLGEATYKDVASRLIKQVVEDQSEVDDEKEQNNIKRRVYDALNVLIAMGILYKEGKNIAYKLGPNGQSFNLAHKERKQKLINELEEKKKQLMRKKEYRKQLILRLKTINQFINRNRLTNSRIPRQLDSLQIKNIENNKIKFGFYCLVVDKEALSTMRISTDADAYKIVMNRQCSFYHDLDVVNRAFGDKGR